jgi:hypothetical protein
MIDLFNVQLFDERACLARAETEIKQAEVGLDNNENNMKTNSLHD